MAVVSQEMVQVREDAWKEKAAMIEEKDKQDGRLKEMEQRLEQVCNVVYIIWNYTLTLIDFYSPNTVDPQLSEPQCVSGNGKSVQISELF